VKTKIKKQYRIGLDDVTPGFEWSCKQCKATNNERGAEISDYEEGTKFKCGLCNATHTFKP